MNSFNRFTHKWARVLCFRFKNVSLKLLLYFKSVISIYLSTFIYLSYLSHISHNYYRHVPNCVLLIVLHSFLHNWSSATFNRRLVLGCRYRFLYIEFTKWAYVLEGAAKPVAVIIENFENRSCRKSLNATNKFSVTWQLTNKSGVLWPEWSTGNKRNYFRERSWWSHKIQPTLLLL